MVDEKPAPKPAAKKSATAPKTVAPAPAPEPETTPEAETEELSPQVSLSHAPAPSPVPKTAYHVVGNADQDEVFLSAAIYKNKYAKKSLTVHHLQRRLAEWGYHDAFADRDGYYGDLTLSSVAAFQLDQGVDGDGHMNAETFKRIFEGDTNVKVVLS